MTRLSSAIACALVLANVTSASAQLPPHDEKAIIAVAVDLFRRAAVFVDRNPRTMRESLDIPRADYRWLIDEQAFQKSLDSVRPRSIRKRLRQFDSFVLLSVLRSGSCKSTAANWDLQVAEKLMEHAKQLSLVEYPDDDDEVWMDPIDEEEEPVDHAECQNDIWRKRG